MHPVGSPSHALIGAPDKRWEAFAAQEPYFFVFPSPQLRRANLTEDVRRKFFEDGEACIDAIIRTIELRLAPHFAPTSILEYGCGNGRLALALARRAARRAGTVTAVDRSPAMLEHARQEAARDGATNIRFLTPAELFAESGTFDFVNCYLLLQRLRPADGLTLVEALLAYLAPGGVAAIQFPYRTTVSSAVALTRAIRERVPAVNSFVNLIRRQERDEPFIPTHTYDLDAVLTVFERAGFAATHVVFDDHDDLRSAIVLAEAPMPTRHASIDQCSSACAIEVRELIASRSIAELNRAAENYFASISDWEYHLTKPFASADEAPTLLLETAVLLQGLQVTPGATVLDFGAGTGWLARFLTQLGCRMILVDVSATALEKARELYERLPPIGDRPAAEFLEFDGIRFGLDDSSIDRIVSFQAFHHVANPDAVLREMARVLKPGGIAAFAEPGPQHSTTEQSQFEMRLYGVVENDIDVHGLWRTAQDCGFRDMRVMVSHGPPFHVSLREFEDLLAGGPTAAAWTASTRTYLRNARNFFLIRDGIERADSRHAHALACEIHASSEAVLATAGMPVDFDLTVTNSGTAVWLPGSALYGGVTVGVHIRHEATGEITTLILPPCLASPEREISPGETRHARVRIPPQLPGRHLVEFDCVASRVAWFAQVGSRPATVIIDVA